MEFENTVIIFDYGGFFILNEEDISQLVHDFLTEEKHCFSDYIGPKLSLGERKKADFFGVSNISNSKKIYFLVGRVSSNDKKDFFKFYEKALFLKEFSDYVYIFEIKKDDFDISNKVEIELCKKEGIGILLIKNKCIKEFLKPQKNNVAILNKKEMIFRIFLHNNNKPISKLIFQSFFKRVENNAPENRCLHYMEIYNSLFSNEKYNGVLKRVLPKHQLTDSGMRQAFGAEFNDEKYIQIQKNDEPIWDYICITDEGMKLGRKPILLD